MHVYGNHDSEGAVSREEQQVIYESFDYCISKTGDDLTGVGNYAIPLLGSNSNELKFVFWGLDSGTYISEEDKINLLPNVPVFEGHVNSPYDYIHQDQIDWYASASAQIEEYTGGVKVPGLMAFHMPLQETYTAWLDRENLGYTGQKRDPVCASAYNSGLFDVICERGDIKAIINGHDHINDFMVNYKGVKLCYSSSFSTNTYNNVDMHGSRVFVIKESDPANIETYMSYVSDAADPSKVEPFEDGYTFDFENTATEFELTGWPYSTVPEYFISQIKADIIGGVGINGSNALGVTREQYHDDYRANNTEVRWEFERAGRIGENKYLMVWMDLSANNVDFRKSIFGLIANDAPSAPYTTDNHDVPSSFYYKAEGSDEWVELKTGNDGCIGVAQDTPLSGYKGWFAFPIEYMPNSTSNGATINENTIITGVYFYMCLASSDMAGKYVYIDNVSLVKELK